MKDLELLGECLTRRDNCLLQFPISVQDSDNRNSGGNQSDKKTSDCPSHFSPPSGIFAGYRLSPCAPS